MATGWMFLRGATIQVRRRRVLPHGLPIADLYPGLTPLDLTEH